jgi:hypothetical protein
MNANKVKARLDLLRLSSDEIKEVNKEIVKGKIDPAAWKYLNDKDLIESLKALINTEEKSTTIICKL